MINHYYFFKKYEISLDFSVPCQKKIWLNLLQYFYGNNCENLLIKKLGRKNVNTISVFRGINKRIWNLKLEEFVFF